MSGTGPDDGFTEVVAKGRSRGASKRGVGSGSGSGGNGLDPSVSTKVETLVADTAAFIRSGVRLDLLAQNVVTTSDVLAEVKDHNSKANLALAVALADVKTRIPSDESIAAVSSFAKKTGDFHVLSSTDIRVLALTWMIEKEKNGVAHLRTEPTRPTQFVSKQKAQASKKANHDTTEDSQKEQAGTDNMLLNSPTTAAVAQKDELDDLPRSRSKSPSKSKPIVEKLKGTLDTGINAPPSIQEESTLPIESIDDVKMMERDESSIIFADEGADDDDEIIHAAEDDDNDDDGWITPQNISKIKEKHLQKIQTQLKEQGTVSVGCITSDFAMQNVLLQMNLKLISMDGVVIKKAKSWIMRCHGCFKTTTDMSKIFCPACGNNTLTRTACSVDEHGRMTYYLKRNYQYNLRGTKYSIPTPKGGHAGKTGGDMILREDQKEFQNAVRSQRIAQKKADYLGLDYVHFSESGGVSGRTGGGGGGGSGAPVVGHGRKNPNAGKGRRRK